ncbi:MAG: hypothetical protein PVH52_00875 [bacterium]|jgi:hypothetical protein
MRRWRWQLFLGLGLVALSALLYYVHYLIFHDPHHIFTYMLGDVAFVPIEVLLVTLIIHRLLSVREKRARLEKLNMVIGTFFSEVGTGLLMRFSDFDPGLSDIRESLLVKDDWSEEEFRRAARRLRDYAFAVDTDKVNLQELSDFLVSKRDFLVRLLENPTLLEHETFTELLRAVFHLTEELQSREDLSCTPESDCAHLGGDIKRAYVLIVNEWFDYMEYLRSNYPFLFSHAMRTNPFDQDASPVVL